MDKRGPIVGAMLCVIGILGCCLLLPSAYHGTRTMFDRMQKEYEEQQQLYQTDASDVSMLKLINGFDVELRQSKNAKLEIYRSNAKASSNDITITNTKDTVIIAKNNVSDVRIKLEDILMRLLIGDTAERVVVYIPSTISLDTTGFSGSIFNLNNVSFANMTDTNLDSLVTDNIAIYQKEVIKKIDEINGKIDGQKDLFVSGTIEETEYVNQSKGQYAEIVNSLDKYLTRLTEEDSSSMTVELKDEICEALGDYYESRQASETIMLKQEKALKSYRNKEITEAVYNDLKATYDAQDSELSIEMARIVDRAKKYQRRYLSEFTNLM